MSGCSALLRCSFRPNTRTKSSKILALTTRNGGGREQGGDLCPGPCLSNVFMESTRLTGKRERDSEPPERANATGTAQPAQAREYGQEQTGSDMELDVSGAENNAEN